MPFSIRPCRRFPVTHNARSFLKLPLAYCSGFWLLITLLLLSSGPAYAEWVAIYSNDTYTLYFDPDTIRRKGDRVKMWELVDYKTAQIIVDVAVLSYSEQIEYDCAEESRRSLTGVAFSGNMGRGKVLIPTSEEKWRPVAPRTVAKAQWKAVCAKQ